jgi:2-polyprenyl-3-methyl-5-hydroxy-6-metoxy-1,4-benzoquinol methylase
VRTARLDEPAIAGNVYDKHGSRNPIVRMLMAGFERGLSDLLALVPAPRQVLEVGCGEGHVTAWLAGRFPQAHVVGIDISPRIIAEAQRLHPTHLFRVQDLYDVGNSGPWDLVVACEVFEHLAEPARGLDAVARASRGHVLVTVPREPLWRVLNVLRGRYWGTLGNTPGHVQHWGRKGILRLLRTRLDIVDTRTPLPWTQALARPPLPS